MSMRFSIPTSLNSLPNSTQIDETLCEITGAEVCAFLHSFDPESRSSSSVTATVINKLIILSLFEREVGIEEKKEPM